MTLEQFQQETDRFRADALEEFGRAANAGELESARIKFLGDRSGLLKSLQQALGALTKDDKPVAGRSFNEVKRLVTEAHESRSSRRRGPHDARAPCLARGEASRHAGDR
jgi:phenylalanyl-tRNA synthetase alpha chain